MLMLPLGLELARWGFAWRVAAYASLFVLTVAIWHTMTFFR